MTLYGDFLSNSGRRIHKWYQYFPVYERHFERLRNQHITLIEIGIGEGGSLQMWRRYFGPFARIVGIDIRPDRKQVEEDQVYVRIGDQEDKAFLEQILAEFGEPDIVIDDGSHYQRHVNTTFDTLYPRVRKNGVYVIEDLHAAYFPNHGGGLGHPGSFIEHAKRLVDEMHATYTGVELARTDVGDRTRSIHFYDSIAVFEVGEHRVLRSRLTGDPTLWRGDWKPSDPSPHEADALEPIRVHFSRGPDDRRPPPDEPVRVRSEASVIGAAHERSPRLQSRISELESEIAIIRSSTSWRITEPLRAIGRLIGRR